MTRTGEALLLAFVAGYGTFLVDTAVRLRWHGLGLGPRLGRGHRRRWFAARSAATQLLQAAGIGWAGFLTATLVLAVLGAVVGAGSFGGPIPAIALAAAFAWQPTATARSRRHQRADQARDAWPALIERLRLEVVSLGRSIPQALFAVRDHAPAVLHPAFDGAHREWLLTSDLERALIVLTDRLADPTADAIAHTLLVAHEVGGSDVGIRLHALAKDRTQDLRERKDARARQAGVRFARLFVIAVPVGMAMVGMSIGDGRAAYAAPTGQVAVLAALATTAACWWWAGRLLRIPTARRVVTLGASGRRAA